MSVSGTLQECSKIRVSRNAINRCQFDSSYPINLDSEIFQAVWFLFLIIINISSRDRLSNFSYRYIGIFIWGIYSEINKGWEGGGRPTGDKHYENLLVVLIWEKFVFYDKLLNYGYYEITTFENI